MPKRSHAVYSGYEPGRTVAHRGENVRTLFNTAIRYAGPRRYSRNRFYQGRGVRSGSYMRRRFSGLRRYPQAGIETKFLDTTQVATALPAPPASATWAGLDTIQPPALCFNAPVQGTGASNREGRKITMQSLQITGLVSCVAQADQTAADTLPVIKLWVVLDKQTNGGTASGIDSELVYTNPSATVLGGLNPLRNMLYTKRYKVLKEIEIDLQQFALTYDGTNMEQGGIHKSFEIFIDLKGRGVEYLGNAGTVADIVDNGLFLLCATSSTTGAPNLTYNARLRFRG